MCASGIYPEGGALSLHGACFDAFLPKPCTPQRLAALLAGRGAR